MNGTHVSRTLACAAFVCAALLGSARLPAQGTISLQGF